VREEVVGLEDNAHAPPYGIQIGLERRDVQTFIEQDAAGIDRFEPIDALEQGLLAGTTRTDEDDDLMLVHIEVDAAQHRL
jgi:hypothetical protein